MLTNERDNPPQARLSRAFFPSRRERPIQQLPPAADSVRSISSERVPGRGRSVPPTGASCLQVRVTVVSAVHRSEL